MTMEASHEYFDLLCAMAAANQASAEEERLLAEHLKSCRACQQSIEQYREIVWHVYEEGMSGEEATAGEEDLESSRAPDEAAEKSRAKERLLRGLRGRRAVTLTAERSNQVERSGLASKVFTLRSAPAWASWAVAASLLIAVGVNSAQYWLSRRLSGDEQARAAVLEKELDDLRGELAAERAERSQSVQKAPPAVEDSAARKLRTENEALRQNLANSEAAREQQGRDFVALRDRERLLQSSLEVLQASKSGLETENTGLAEKVSELKEDVRKTQEEMTKLTAQNDALSQEALSKVKYVERQQKLLATDHDIRDILGSRSLHIIDVYDVSGEGELERPFGRIFYTEGKSLIFYAFDLDQQKGLKRGSVFQAWGQKAEGKESPRSLGTFYMDDSSQNRWVLRVDDGKALSRIDYVYVTDSSRKESVKPKGKPLLSAFLNGPANHP